jgi:uncharacterized protein YdeI (YjbR/CyaY-like superfamily)
MVEILFFPSPSELRKWFQRNHDKSVEQWIGFYKRSSGKSSITWPESVDEALCFGWIDGIRKSIDEVSYKIRFTPRKSRSIWSSVNVKRAKELMEMGRMHPSGLKTFEERDLKRSGLYSYEQRIHKLDESYEKQFRSNRKAWIFFQSQPPWYQRTSSWWVMSAKKEETRSKRLSILIEDSAKGRTVGPLTRAKK